MKYTLASLIFSAVAAQGATLNIIVQNTFAGSSNPFLDEDGTALTTGDLVNLGYFTVSDAPAAGGVTFNNFVSIDTAVITLGLDGTFATDFDLDDTVDTPGTSDLTLQFGLRIFNNTTEANSTFFNTVTSSDWEFSFSSATPPPLPSEIVLDPILRSTNGNEIWEGGPTSAFTTTIATAVPEPSSNLTLLLGSALLLGSRRRK